MAISPLKEEYLHLKVLPSDHMRAASQLIMHDLENVVTEDNVCNHAAFLTSRDNSQMMHAYLTAGQKPKPKGVRFFGQLVVYCPGGQGRVLSIC